MSEHDDHGAFEAAYWGDCTNTFDEEQKHYVYAQCMGIKRVGYAFDVGGKRILDIGGGPVSMLLKCKYRGFECVVADPLLSPNFDGRDDDPSSGEQGKYPYWVLHRYQAAKIGVLGSGGEAIQAPVRYLSPETLWASCSRFDEVWIYNCLQHTDDPAKIIANAKALAPVLRLFEWIDIPPHEGHPHMLTQATLEQWISQPGHVGEFAESGCYGRAFFGYWVHK